MDNPWLETMEVLDDGHPHAHPLVFIHGYPDDSSMWEAQVTHFRDRFRCVRISLPGFGERKLQGPSPTFPEVTGAIHAALSNLQPKLNGPVTLVTHDWGAIYGYLFCDTYPDMVAHMVALDVAPTVLRQESPVGYALLPSYQLGFAAAYVLGQNKWTRPLAGLLSKGFSKLLMELNGDHLAGPSRRTPFDITQNYPYYQFWKEIVRRRQLPQIKTPKIPFLYAYGDDGMKRYMSFHDKRWLEEAKRKPRVRIRKFSGAGHWLMLDQKDAFNHELEAFLRDQEAPRTQAER